MAETATRMSPLWGLVPMIPLFVLFFVVLDAQERFFRMHASQYGLWPDTPWWYLLPLHPRYWWVMTKAQWRPDPHPEVEAARRRLLRVLLVTLAYMLLLPLLVGALWALLGGVQGGS